jgi:hypothetical protein
MEQKQVLLAGVTGVMTVLLTLTAVAPGPPSVTITSIKSGQTVTGTQIPVTVDVSNFTIECADIGMPGKSGQGHIHAMIDGTNMTHLTNFYCSRSFDISGIGLRPGNHVLAVTLADDAHTDITKPATVSFNDRPAVPQALPGAMTGGKPSVTILRPQNGATVGKKFNLVMQVKNFDLSCDLEGKPDIPGWGHIHVFLHQAGADRGMNEMHGGMMSMAGMISMPCSTRTPVDLTAWHSGKTHILVMLVNNDHDPVMGAASSAIDVILK